MKIINMTPHEVNIGKIVISRCGEQIRLSTRTVEDEPIVLDNGISIPTSRTEFGDVVGLSPQADGVYYIVSQLVQSTLPDRTDLLVPAELVRDERGNIVGCGSLGR